ncbi:unnamed protein product [Effrenium voratum]|nr:unnamed protein product [Effrenium voratum]
MPPFWASQKDEPSSVLLDEYAADPQPKPASSKRPLFPAGAPVRREDRKDRNTLPAQIVKTDPRREREFANRHIVDKRLGAKSRAEMLRQQILRGSQEETVLRGSDAFRQRSAPGYRDMDNLQPEGTKGRPRPEPEEDDSSDVGSSGASGEVARPFGPLPKKPKRRRLALAGGPSRGESGGDVVVDYF